MYACVCVCVCVCAVEDEREWAQLKDQAEAEIRLEIAEMIWEDLILDTAQTLLDLESEMASAPPAKPVRIQRTLR